MTDKQLKYYELSPLDFEGKGWQNTEMPFDRIQKKYEHILPDLWKWSHSPTGMCIYFNSDTANLSARYELGEEQLGEPNFNYTACSGVDVYIFDEAENRWRWAAATPFQSITSTQIDAPLLTGLPEGKMRRYLLYLPLRNRMLKIAVGVDSKAVFEKVPPRHEQLLVYYGTSIIHGAYAIRSGTGTPQRLARMLDMPLINLGFSGTARLEKEMAEMLSELDAKVYVVDPYHNLTPELAEKNTENFIRTLCSRRPEIPVFMLGAPPRLESWLFPAIRDEEAQKTRIYGNICRRMKKEFANLHYLKGENFYGSDDVSTDGIHPNDEAFARMSKILFREIAKVLEK